MKKDYFKNETSLLDERVKTRNEKNKVLKEQVEKCNAEIESTKNELDKVLYTSPSDFKKIRELSAYQVSLKDSMEILNTSLNDEKALLTEEEYKAIKKTIVDKFTDYEKDLQVKSYELLKQLKALQVEELESREECNKVLQYVQSTGYNNIDRLISGKVIRKPIEYGDEIIGYGNNSLSSLMHCVFNDFVNGFVDKGGEF